MPDRCPSRTSGSDRTEAVPPRRRRAPARGGHGPSGPASASDSPPFARVVELALRAERKSPQTVKACRGTASAGSSSGPRARPLPRLQTGPPWLLSRRGISSTPGPRHRSARSRQPRRSQVLPLARGRRDDPSGTSSSESPAQARPEVCMSRSRMRGAGDGRRASGLDQFRDRRDEALVLLHGRDRLPGRRSAAVMNLSDLQLPAGAGSGSTRQRRQGPPGALRSSDDARAGPVHPGSPHPPARRHRCAMARRPRQTVPLLGLHKALGMRARRAGIPGFHPHILRHIPRRIAGLPPAAPKAA